MAKKQLIMDTALELFAEQGFDATSVQQITDKCGISKGAFYLSFKSKDELILTLIDHFMQKIISDIDHIVINPESQENILYNFYYVSFDIFREHSNFAKIFMKEQNYLLTTEFITKLQDYNKLVEKSILKMVEKIYGNKVEANKYDLVYCIKGFMKTYAELFITVSIPIDLKKLCESLVEKTNIIAIHTTIPFITEQIVQTMQKPICRDLSKEELIQMIETTFQEIEEPIVKESLALLREELLNSSLSLAVIKGLLENIYKHPECKWIAYVLSNYFEFK